MDPSNRSLSHAAKVAVDDECISLQHIETLCMELFRALAFRLAKTCLAVDDKAQKRRVRFLIREIKRMFAQNQAFPSDIVKAKLLMLLRSASRFRFQMQCKKLLVAKQMEFIETRFVLHTKGPEFTKLQPWEIFLSDAGKWNTLPTSIPRSIRQLLPMSAMSIIMSFEATERRTVQYMNSVSYSFSDKSTIEC